MAKTALDDDWVERRKKLLKDSRGIMPNFSTTSKGKFKKKKMQQNNKMNMMN